MTIDLEDGAIVSRGDHQLHQHIQPGGAGAAGLVARKRLNSALRRSLGSKHRSRPAHKSCKSIMDKGGLTEYHEPIGFNLGRFG